jgi:hypothetical protein
MSSGRKVMAIALFAAIVSATGAQDGVTVDVTSHIEASVGAGILRDVAEVAPEMLGSSGRLDPVEYYGFSDRTEQTVFRTDLMTAISIRQPVGRATLFYDASVVAGHSPIGYWPRTTATVYPGPTGISVDVKPATWDGARFGATLGRFRMLDPTGFVLSHLADGLSLGLRWPRLYAGAGFGYIGLLDKYANNIRFSDDDIAELFEPSHYPAPPRAAGTLQIDYKDLARQDISVFGVTQIDFRTDGDQRSSWYGGLAGSGWIPGDGTHTTFLVIGGTWPDVEVGMMGGTDVVVPFDIGVPLEVETELTYASGQGANLSPFPALDSPPAGEVIAAEYTALFTALLSARIHLEPGFVAGHVDPELWAKAIVSTQTDGPAPAVGPYYGTEIGLKVPYQPVADVRLELLLGFHLGPVLATDTVFFSRFAVEIDL